MIKEFIVKGVRYFGSGDDLADVDQSDNDTCRFRVVIEVRLIITFLLRFAVALLTYIIDSVWNSGRL